MKKITARSGITLKVKTSKKAFQEAGFGKFKSGQKVIGPDGNKWILEGLAFGTCKESEIMVMWCTMLNEKGSRYHYPVSPSDFEPT